MEIAVLGMPRGAGIAFCESDTPLSVDSIARQKATDAAYVATYMQEQQNTCEQMAHELNLLCQLALPDNMRRVRLNTKRLDAWLTSSKDTAAADSKVQDEVWIVIRTFRQKQQSDPHTWFVCDAGECCPFESLDEKRVKRHERRCLYCHGVEANPNAM